MEVRGGGGGEEWPTSRNALLYLLVGLLPLNWFMSEVWRYDGCEPWGRAGAQQIISTAVMQQHF